MTENEVTLYNKYRPKRFDEIVGQTDTVNAIQRGIANKKLPHTLLFEGPRGTGKTTTARIAARALNCSNLQENGEPCGECESCSFEIDAMPGFYEYDAGSNSGVADAREIVDAIASGNPLAKNQVFIIDEVHLFSTQAQSALLKSTEEPPPGTYIIFATTDPEQLIPSSRSRSSVLPFSEVSDEDLTTLVERVIEAEGEEVSEDTIMGIVAEGDGSPRDTLSTLQRVLLGGAVTASGKGLELATAVVNLDVVGALTAVAEVVRDGGSIYTLNIELLSFLRDMMIAKSAPNLVSERRLQEIEEAVSLSPELSNRARRAIPFISSVARSVRTASEPRGLFESEIIGFVFDEQRGGGETTISTIGTDRLEQKVDTLLGLMRNSSKGGYWPGVDDVPVSVPETPAYEPEVVPEGVEAKVSASKEGKAEPFSVDSLRESLEKELPARFSSRLPLLSIQESEAVDETIEIIYDAAPGARWPSNLKEAVLEAVEKNVPEGYGIDLLYPSKDGFLDLDS